MLRIGDFSKLCKVTIKALRYYDELGILKPDYISEENGYRFYKPEQLRKISEIVSYKEMGLSLDEISFIILDNPTPGDVLKMLIKKQSEVKIIINSEKEKLTKINSFIKDLKEEKFMNEVNLKSLPEVIVASIRTTIPNYEYLNTLAPQMGEKMKAHGAVCREPAYCFNIYHDGEYKETDIDVELCESVVKACPNDDGVIYKKVDEVKDAACYYHKGPYSALGKSYAEVFKWIESNGYKVTDNPRESYIDGCWNKDDPSEWLTEIQVPISKQ